MKYVSSLIVVKNIERSKAFYEKVLKQKVQYDFGENVAFKGGFAIHDQIHFQKVTGKVNPEAIQ
jgi:hypothetical protein